MTTYAEKLAARQGRRPEFDPYVTRAQGRAIQGNTPFDVTWISEIEGNLHMGGVIPGRPLPRAIKHVVNLYGHNYDLHDELRSLLFVPMNDSLEQVFDNVERVARWVVECVEDDVTLVHCQQGLNRSGLITARALMLMGRTADEAIALIQSQRSPACLCNVAFADYLRSL